MTLIVTWPRKKQLSDANMIYKSKEKELASLQEELCAKNGLLKKLSAHLNIKYRVI
jgi:acetoacetate decarboxylase